MSQGQWFGARAPAKVNLFLEVLARRADGFHELDTLMLALDLCDELRVRTNDEGVVRCAVRGPFASPDIPIDSRNLAVRAAQSVLEHARRVGWTSVGAGLELEVVKNVPSQAGLGGASADAAAAMEAAELAFGQRLPDSIALAALADLGSDCAFFRAAATTGFARCTGRGEVVTVLPPLPSQLTLLVVTPDLGASTPEVYRRLADPLSWAAERRIVLPRFKSATRPAGVRLDFEPFNRLESAAFLAFPRLLHWRDALVVAAQTPFWLSGSGASFFALFENSAAAHSARTALERTLEQRSLRPRGVWVSHPKRSAQHPFDA